MHSNIITEFYVKDLYTFALEIGGVGVGGQENASVIVTAKQKVLMLVLQHKSTMKGSEEGCS